MKKTKIIKKLQSYSISKENTVADILEFKELEKMLQEKFTNGQVSLNIIINQDNYTIDEFQLANFDNIDIESIQGQMIHTQDTFEEEICLSSIIFSFIYDDYTESIVFDNSYDGFVYEKSNIKAYDIFNKVDENLECIDFIVKEIKKED